MNLDLTPEQPNEPMTNPHDAHGAETAPAILATVVTTDGVVVRLCERADGSLALIPNGNRAPLVLDRFQRLAMMAALGEG